MFRCTKATLQSRGNFDNRWATLNMICSVIWYLTSLWQFFGWHFLWVSLLILSHGYGWVRPLAKILPSLVRNLWWLYCHFDITIRDTTILGCFRANLDNGKACPNPHVGAHQPIHWVLGGKNLGIQRGTSAWVGSTKSKFPVLRNSSDRVSCKSAFISMCSQETTQLFARNEPLGAKGPPLVGEEVPKKDVGKVRSSYIYINHP